MEVTCQLRADQLSKKGTARIQLTYCWDGKRLRLSSGEKCRKQDWNDKKQRVKANPGAYAEQINAVLDRYTQAGQDVHQQARLQLQQLDASQMEEAIRQRYAELAAAATGQPLVQLKPAAPQVSFLDHMDRWLEYQADRISLTSGRRLSQSYLTGLRLVRRECARFSDECRYPLTFEGMDDEFFQAFTRFQLVTRGYDLNTFGTHTRRLKGFLRWAMRKGLPVNMHFLGFETPDIYRGADFLTQEELLRLAALDFTTPAARTYLAEHFTPAPWGGLGRPPVSLAEHTIRIEQARDKMLECCYFALRLSDADKLAPEHLHGDVVRFTAGKTGGICIIPFLDDDVFKPRALVAKYADQGLNTCLPIVYKLDDYLPHIQHLAGIERIKLTSRVGRKTFATLKIYQGIPKAQVMLATGHTTEKSFNRYLGINEEELVEQFRRTARKSVANPGA